jgi:hypothetical protein
MKHLSRTIIAILLTVLSLSFSIFSSNAIGRTIISYKDPEGGRLKFKIPASKLRKVQALISQKYPGSQCGKWTYDPHKEIYFKSCAQGKKRLEIHLYEDHSITAFIFGNNSENVIGDWSQ